jgi:hypothetical protein
MHTLKTIKEAVSTIYKDAETYINSQDIDLINEGYGMRNTCITILQHIEKAETLENIRQSLRDCSSSYGELCELQSMMYDIHPTDIELCEASGMNEEEYRKRLELWKLNNKENEVAE